VSTGGLITSFSPHRSCVQGLVWLDGQTFLSADEGGYVVGNDARSPTPAWSFALPEISVCTLSLLRSPLESNDITVANIYGAGATKGSARGGLLVVAGGVGGAVCAFDCRSGKVLGAARLHNDDVRGVVPMLPLTPSSSSSQLEPPLPAFATTSFDGSAAVWQLQQPQSGPGPALRATGGQASGAPGTNKGFSQISLLSGAHTDKVLGCAFAPLTQQLVTTGADGMVVLWSPGPKLGRQTGVER